MMKKSKNEIEKKWTGALSEYMIYFIIYSMIGWIYETVLEVAIYRWGFSNRGVLFGPWLPVYGFGAVLFLLLWYRLIKARSIKEKCCKIPLIFILTMGTATALELMTSYLCQWFLGSWPWQNYVNYTFNFQGRIALNPSIRFGIGGLVFLYVIQPFLDKFTDKLSSYHKKIIAIVILSILFADVLLQIFSNIV